MEHLELHMWPDKHCHRTHSGCFPGMWGELHGGDVKENKRRLKTLIY